jgi:hypothetical protein
MKNSSDTTGNQTRDLLASAAVLQPNAVPRAHNYEVILVKYYESLSISLTQLSGMQNIFAARFYIVICYLSDSTIFFHIIKHYRIF